MFDNSDHNKTTHQLCTICTDGVVSSLSGRRLISFMMLESLTGSSCLRKTKDVFSQALMDPESTQGGETLIRAEAVCPRADRHNVTRLIAGGIFYLL